MIEITRTVKLSLASDDWGLYDIPGSSEAADRLNLAVADAINSTATWSQAYTVACVAMNNESEYGAADTEGKQALKDILRQVYGSDY